MAEPQRAVAYTVPAFGLDAFGGAGFQVDPTIVAGDFKISKDFGAFVNLGTLPTVSPSGSSSVKIELSATEMTADKIRILGIDVAGSEWDPIEITIDNPVSNSENVADLLEGDYVETNLTRVINKRGTSTALLSKTIVGSLLVDGVVIQTFDA